MKKILWIDQEDVKRGTLLRGPIKGYNDYVYCTTDRKDFQQTDIVIAHTLNNNLAIIKSRNGKVGEITIDELGVFLANGAALKDKVKQVKQGE